MGGGGGGGFMSAIGNNFSRPELFQNNLAKSKYHFIESISLLKMTLILNTEQGSY